MNGSQDKAHARPLMGGLPKVLTPYIFSLYMAFIMSLAMSAVLVAANVGIDDDYIDRVMASWRVAFPSAFAIVLVVRPVVLRLVALTVRPH